MTAITFSHAFRLPLPPDKAIELFTASGETLWVPGWAPRYVDPPDGTTVQGMVWTTEQDRVWWLCMAWDPAGHAAYVRLTPGVKLAHVKIWAEPDDQGARVSVSYEWKALSERGRAEIGAITRERYAAEIDQWHAQILSALIDGRIPG